jgi:hypothetical protein
MNPIQLDTTQAATDQSGLTSTSTRTIIIEASPSIVPSDAASTTQATFTVQ